MDTFLVVNDFVVVGEKKNFACAVCEDSEVPTVGSTVKVRNLPSLISNDEPLGWDFLIFTCN